MGSLFFSRIALVAVLYTFSLHVSALPQPIDEQWIDGDVLAQLPPSPIDQTPSNLTLGRYPPLPYGIVLPNNYNLVIYRAENYVRRPLPSVPDIRTFFREFAEDLAEHYPSPAHTPRVAGKEHYDVKESFTRWNLEVDVMPLLAKPAPTEIVVAALLRMAAEVKKFGPPEALSGHIYTTAERLGMRQGILFSIKSLESAEIKEMVRTGEGADTA
ncbi:MAG: hypothetical protein Q9174_004110 [Haloplaca sp. 1 TL-2023]